MNPCYDPMRPQWQYQMPWMYRSLEPRFLVACVRPLVDYGLEEAQVTSERHAMFEVTLIAYLMGMGYDYYTAHRIVESWEVDEIFPGE